MGNKKKETGLAFKWFHATSLTGTAMIIAAVVASYFSVYMTDTMLLPAASCSIIMFVATLWDAINDPIMGVIADKTHTRFGKYRPYFLFAPVLLTIFGTLIWVNPDFSTNGKIAWVLITYIGYGMTVTMYTMPQVSVLPACVKNDKERNVIVTMGAGMMSISFLIGNTFTGSITGFFESLGFSNGYIPFMLICGILSCISFWGLFATSKEKYIQPNTGNKGDLKKVLKHYELTPYIIVWVMASLGYGLMFSSSIYYIIYYLGRPDLIGAYMGVISIGGAISMIVFMPIALKIFKSGHRALLWTQVGAAVCYATLLFFGKSSIPFLFVMSFIATAIASMSNALVNVLVNDAIDYIRLKENITANGVISSIKGFAQKCGTTVVSSGLLAVLAAAGYVANQPQTESALRAINFMRFGAPICTAVIVIICLQFNPVEKCKKEILEMKEKMGEPEEYEVVDEVDTVEA